MKQPITKNRKKHLQNLPRNNSGRNATVKMGSYEGQDSDGKTKYYAAPTITFKGDEEARPQSFKQALDAGEVYEFNIKKRAERFAGGSWKKGKDKRDAMKAYRLSKKSN